MSDISSSIPTDSNFRYLTPRASSAHEIPTSISYFDGEQKVSLRRMKFITEAPVVIMPLDWSSHSTYCLTFYLKYIHKPANKVHVCYVAETLRPKMEDNRPVTKRFSDHFAESREEGESGCLAALKRCLTPMTSIKDTMGPSPGMINELERQDRVNCSLVKAEVKDIFASNSIQHWDFKRLTGEEPWKAILDYREEMRGTLIVLGSRGLGTIKRNIFGSVSDKVLRKSTVPVLIVRRPHGALNATTNTVTGVSTIY